MSKRKPNKNKRVNQGEQRKKTAQNQKSNQRKATTQKKTVKTNNKSKQNKKKVEEVNWKAIQPTDKVSLVIPCYNEENRVGLLVDGIRKFDRQWGAQYELIIVDDGSSDNTVEAIQNKLNELTRAENFEIITLEKNQGKGNALKAGVERASGDFILTLDADMAAEPLELKKWLAELPNAKFPKDEILIASREHSKSKVSGQPMRKAVGLLYNFVIQLVTSLTVRDTQCGFKLYPADIAKELFASMKVKGWAHDVEMLYKGQLSGYNVRSMPITWKHVDDSKIDVWKDGIMMVFVSIFTAWRIKFDWFIGQPVRDLGKKQERKGEHSIFRLLFVVATLLLLVTMPMLHGDFGVTGDEYVQKVYGEMVNEHFSTNGTYTYDGTDNKYKGQNAMNMTPNLYYYGGYFDYLAAKIYSATGADPYETRHLVNALVGFLLMFFTGLLAKEISGSWKIALLALLMVALSPRIFGHSFNNPKDIPFAAAYIFTLLNIFRFVKQLPNPSAKTILYLIMGIACSIGIRIGGLLLVAYLGFFTGLAFLWHKHLRQKLFSFNLPVIGKVAFYGVLVAFLGYMGGLYFWPYGWEAPFENPLKALSEMSNFDTAIQMLYEGKHTWSDQLPAYYIPKWMLMTAPIAVMIGMIMFVPIVFLNKKKNWFTVGLIAFSAIFPPAYAIYQGSALYDGMRHFLFVYPVLVVIAAYAWGMLGDIIPNKMAKLSAIVVPVLLLALPLTWMLKNHPYHYTYVNEAYGGVKSLEHKYETDYWMISVKPLVEWAVENIPEIKTEERVVIYMSDQIEAARHYFKKLAPNVRVKWEKYSQRDNSYNWDYAILFNRFMNEGHLKSGTWPPYEVIHEEKVDGVTMGVVCKKASPHLGEARKAFKEGHHKEAINAFQQELAIYPKNELAWLGMAQAAQAIRDFPTMKKAVDGAKALSSSHVNTIGMEGMYYYFIFEDSQRKNPAAPNIAALDSSILVFNQAIAENYKYPTGYQFLAYCYRNKRDFNSVVKNVELFAENNALRNPQVIQVFDIGIQAAKQLNDNIAAGYFEARKALAQNNGSKAYQLVNQVYSSNPRYEPNAALKEQLDELVEKQRKQQLQKQQTPNSNNNTQ